jgi:hypothetical protein
MGVAWHAQDSYAGYRYAPKLTMAGRLSGTLAGRPVVIEASESGLILSAQKLRTAWGLRKTSRSLRPVVEFLKTQRIPLRVSVAGLVSLEVLPIPNTLVRLLAPDLADAAFASGEPVGRV